tara:strand:+ start:1517 stop:1753 length:237 start_codon:yes stop_codon:yes gene_type:complete
MVYITDFIVNFGLFIGETIGDVILWAIAIYVSIYFIAAEILGVSVYTVLGGHYLWNKLGISKPKFGKTKKQDMFYEDA